MNRKFYICFVICALLGQVLMAQNVTISPTSGSYIAGISEANPNESGKVAGFYSTWKHSQLALTLCTSDVPNLTGSGDIDDPACTLSTYNGKMILANGATQTFMVVSLPNGYRITGYTIVLQPDLNGKDVINYSGGGKSSSQAANFNPLGTEATCFYETKAWDGDFPYTQDSKGTFKSGTAPLSSDQYLAVAKAADGDWEMNPGTDGNKTFTISRTSDDMGNRLYFWVGFATSYYGFSINSFEIQFTAEGTFEANVAPTAVGQATNYVRAPFATSKTELGAITYNTSVGRYTYNASTVQDLVGYNHLYQDDAVGSDGYPATGTSATNTITPVNVDGQGLYAFGNNTYWVEPPVDILTPSGAALPIGFRIVGAKFNCLWGTETKGQTVTQAATCQIYYGGSGRNSSKNYLSSDLHFGNTTAIDWLVDEYGNIYTGSGDNKQYLACYGEGTTRMLSLSSTPTGAAAKWNLRRDDNSHLYYQDSHGVNYYLYTKSVSEGSTSHYRGYVIESSNNTYSAPSGYTAVTCSAPTGGTKLTLPDFSPGAYTLTVCDKEGNETYTKTISSASEVTSEVDFDLDGYNNDAVKFIISGLPEGKQALVDITLKLEALNPYIKSMTVVCTDNNTTPTLKMTQTFTADDFMVNGGAFLFVLPEICAEDDVNITFEDLSSPYGDETYNSNTDEQGHQRYSFVSSPYFRAFDLYAGNAKENQIDGADFDQNDETDLGLYDTRYKADIPKTHKIYTGVAGDKAFKFNNADDIADLTSDKSANFLEYAFSVTKYLAPTSQTFSDGQSGTGGSFANIVMNASAKNGHSNKGSYYLFTADETRYNIAPSKAWQHRYYAFYKMDVEVQSRTYTPVVTFSEPIYSETYRSTGVDTNAFYGVTVTAPYEEEGTTKQGYVATNDIAKAITAAIKDETASNKPKDSDHILYLDMSQLAGVLVVSGQEGDSEISYTAAPNCISFLPVGTTSANDNVAYKTQSGTFHAANNIRLTDKEPFYTPYDIQVEDNRYVYYDRGVSRYGAVKKSTMIMPFAFDVNESGQVVGPNPENEEETITYFSLYSMQAENCLTDNPTKDDLDTEEEDEYPAYVFFPQIETVKGQTEANKPYLVKVDNPYSEDISFRVRKKGGAIVSTSWMDKNNYLFKGESAKGSSKAGQQSGLSVDYSFTAYGGYAGKNFKRDSSTKKFDATYFYFANNRFVSSDNLMESYSNLRCLPFRSYYVVDGGNSGVKGLTELGIIFGEGEGNSNVTSINNVTGGKADMLIRSGKGTISITSDKEQDVKIHSVSGINMHNVSMQAGETRTVNVPAGIYIVNGVKLIVK